MLRQSGAIVSGSEVSVDQQRLKQAINALEEEQLLLSKSNKPVSVRQLAEHLLKSCENPSSYEQSHFGWAA